MTHYLYTRMPNLFDKAGRLHKVRRTKGHKIPDAPLSQWPNAGHKPRDVIIYRHDGRWWGSGTTQSFDSLVTILALLSPLSLAPESWT